MTFDAKQYWIVDRNTGQVISSVMLEDKNVQEFLDLVEEQGYLLADGYEEAPE